MFLSLYKLLNTIISLYELVLLVYVILSWVRPAANQFTEIIRRLVEPALMPIRRILSAHLPMRWQFIDWSVLVLWLLIGVAQRILSIFFSILL